MKVNINGTEWSVRWYHERYSEPIERLFSDGKGHARSIPVRGGTVCRISAPNGNGHTAFFGYVWCSIKDKWDRQEGRKRSLKRALRKAALAKADRRSFWLAYDEEIGVIHRKHGVVAATL